MVSLYTAFTAAVRVIHRIHSHAAIGWPAYRAIELLPALPYVWFSWSRLPIWPIVAMQSSRNFSHFTRRQLNQRQLAFFAQQLR